MIWNQSVQRRSAATRVYEQWHGESLSCRIPYERGKWRWFVLGQGGGAGTSAAVWAVRTHVSGTSPKAKLARLWAAVSVTPAAHQHINGI